MQKFFSMLSYGGLFVVFILALLTCADVIGRYLFNSPIPGTFEISEELLCVLAAFGISTVTYEHSHISVDSLYRKMKPKNQRILALIADYLGILVFAVFAWQGLRLVYDSITPDLVKTSADLRIPIFPFLFCLFVAFALSFVALLHSVIHPDFSHPEDDSSLT